MSQKPEIFVTRKLPKRVEDRASRDYGARLNGPDDAPDREALLTGAQGCDGLLVTTTDRVDRAVIEALPDRVKVIATFSVGFEHIDVAAAKDRGIVVTNTPDVLTDATADIALLLMLGAARRASEGERMIRAHAWDGWAPTRMLGTDLGGKVLAIVGMGRIGRAFAKRARSLGMTIHYYNRSRLSPDLEEGAVYHANAEELLGHGDVVSLHCPLTPETRHFIDTRRIGMMKQGTILVNTARGGVVKDDDLIAALKSGRLGSAGLDVFEGEPNLHKGYAELENTFLLPHLGSATLETREAMGFKALDNLDAFFAGKAPPDRIA